MDFSIYYLVAVKPYRGYSDWDLSLKKKTLESFLVKNIKSSRRKSVIFVARCTHSSLGCQSLNMMFMSSARRRKVSC